MPTVSFLVDEDQDMVTVPVGSWSSIAVAVEVVGVDGVAEPVPLALGGVKPSSCSSTPTGLRSRERES